MNPGINAEQAKAIPLTDLLARLGHPPALTRGHYNWYLSPLRAEKRPSFHLHRERNVWYDFGDGRGGNALDFTVYYLEAQGRTANVSDALAFLSDLMGKALIPSPAKTPESKPAKQEKLLKLDSLKSLQHPALIKYLQARGINVEIARLYLKEASVRHTETGKRFFVLALANEDGGFELRNLYYKGCIAPKAISFMRGSVPKPGGIHTFEGWPDFLTVLTRERTDRLKYDAISLNSLSMLESGLAYLKGYGYEKLFSWLHNDKGGATALTRLAEFVQTEERLTLYPMNKLYAGYKDVNEWHTINLAVRS
jgi:hypothetical protein